jgi:hypothetical protein
VTTALLADLCRVAVQGNDTRSLEFPISSLTLTVVALQSALDS